MENSFEAWEGLYFTLMHIDIQYPSKHKDDIVLEALDEMIEEAAEEDLEFLCKMLIYFKQTHSNRYRTVNYIAGIISNKLSGKPFAKSFYEKVVFSPKDMFFILKSFQLVSNTKGNPKLSNSMKKGFKSVLEKLTNDELINNRKFLVDLLHLVHPNPEVSNRKITYKGKEMYTFEAIIKKLIFSHVSDNSETSIVIENKKVPPTIAQAFEEIDKIQL